MSLMSDDTPPVPPVPPAASEPVTPPPPPAVPEAALPNPYAQPYAQQYVTAPPTNTLSIVALILAFFVPLAAIICGHIALGQIKRTGQGGRGLALAGTVLGYVFIGLGILFGIIYAVIIVAAVSSGNYSSNP
ncbi:hypothetical protein BH10ACT6_BH10ACT6_14530 [soil metagenome]